MIASLFQTASGSWHLPSILMASSFLIGSIITGAFIFSQLVANRSERMKAFDKEQIQLQELKDARAKITNLENKTTPLQQKLKEVEEKAKPRVIPTAKLSAIQTELSKHRGDSIVITCLMNDHEAFSFASQLKKVFESSGWSVNGVNQAVFSAPIKGIIITMKDKTLEPKATFIFQLLQSAGFNSQGEINDKQSDVGLIIGSKE